MSSDGYLKLRTASPPRVNPVDDDCTISESASFLRGEKSFKLTAGQLAELHAGGEPEPSHGRFGIKKGFFRRLFYEIFLPQGYPDSVSPDYLNYQLWDTLQV
jgi:hypothetical protein